MPDFRTLTGHLSHGIVMGSVFGCFSVTGQVFQDASYLGFSMNEITICLWVGIITSMIFGFIPLWIFWNVELGWQLGAIFIVKFMYCFLVGFGGTYYITQLGQYTFQFSMISGGFVFSILLTASVMCFKRRMFD